MGRPKESARLKMRRDFVEARLGSQVICQQCGATLQTYSDVCSAALSDLCPGFMTVENALQEFERMPTTQH